MQLDSTTIVHRLTLNDGAGYVLGVVLPGRDVRPYKEFRSAFVGIFPDATENQIKATWQADIAYYVAADRDGKELLRMEPFLYPSSCLAEGLVRPIYTPSGIPDILPAYDSDNHTATVNPAACQLSQSLLPSVIASWWWRWHYGGIPRAHIVKAYKIVDGERVWLPARKGANDNG